MNTMTRDDKEALLKNFIPSKRMLSNFILTKELKERFFSGEALYLSHSNHWMLLLKEASFYRLYYSFGRETISEDLPSLKKSLEGYPLLVTEYVTKREDALQEEVLASLGFKKLIKRKRFKIKPEEVKVQASSLPISCASLEDAPVIMKLYKEAFEPYTSKMPSMKSLEKSIQEGSIYVYKEASLLGVLEHLEEKTTELTHLVVAPEARGKGVGRQLVEHYLREVVLKEKMPGHLFTEEKNPVISLYESVGYREDPLYSLAHVKEE